MVFGRFGRPSADSRRCAEKVEAPKSEWFKDEWRCEGQQGGLPLFSPEDDGHSVDPPVPPPIGDATERVQADTEEDWGWDLLGSSPLVSSADAQVIDDYILVEEYIAGRECRVAVLEREDGSGLKMEILPKLEYILEDIREQKHKLGVDASGKLMTGDANPAEAILKGKEEGERVCPAVFEPEVHARLDELAKKAHTALGCKYYSLYDVRINKEGFPFMLESCLFCSFSPYSVIVTLAGKTTDDELQPHPKVFEGLLRRAAKETRGRRAEASSTGGVPLNGGIKRRKVAA
mmetsp:Transcript_82595/g.250487  ORF Transcript_82595/g.250487 Transcript_82595/m.250487 type:complete len:290 (+) Transcript_82595:217-1086(+)